MPGIKQEALTYELGDDWNQKKISLLEAKETIEPNVRRVAKALKVVFYKVKERKWLCWKRCWIRNRKIFFYKS
jgi:hypothetical protein